MDEPSHNPHERAGIAEQAAEWLQRLKNGDAADRRAFLRWLKRSPQNVGETLLATTTDLILRHHFRKRPVDAGRDIVSDNVIHVAPRAATRHSTRASRPKRWAWRAGLAAAASVLAVVLMQSFLGDWWRQKEFVTAVGEQRTIELSDGSSVSINTASHVRVHYSETAREVLLDDGQALFNVAKDAKRPFRVHVGGSIVQAVGTKFDVRWRAGAARVAVAEGTVQIGRDAPRQHTSPSVVATLTAGEAVRINAPGNVDAPVPIRIAEIGLWQQRRLIFADTPLAEIADEFARYNRRPLIRIEGEALRARRLSGVFDADSPEALLVFFAGDETIDVQQHNDEIIIRTRPVIVHVD